MILHIGKYQVIHQKTLSIVFNPLIYGTFIMELFVVNYDAIKKALQKVSSLISLSCILCSEYSKQLNASRLEVLQAQDDLAMSMLEAAGKELLYITRDHHVYKNLLRIFIVQVSKVIFASGNLWSCCILFSNNTSMHAISNALTSTSEHTCCKGNTI